MAGELHPAATHHLPMFVTPPGETDALMTVTIGILAVSVMMFGILFLRIHTLPERIAHKSHKLQFEIVAVLGLIALFTHMHIFWIAGLLLALIDFPDFGTSLNRIAGSTEKIAGIKPGDGAGDLPAEIPESEAPPSVPDERPASVPHEAKSVPRQSEGGTVLPIKPETASKTTKELIRA